MSVFGPNYDKLKGFERLCYHASYNTDGEYYFETGRYKPWSVQTLKAAQRRGLVEKVVDHKPVYLVTLSEEGYKLGEKVKEKLNVL